MMKILRSQIFAFVMGAILFSVLSVLAATLNSKDILFNPQNTNWKVDNVNDALNYLYGIADLNLELYSSDSITGTLTTSRKNSFSITKGKYLLIINVYNAGATITGLNTTATLSSTGNVTFKKIKSVVNGYDTVHSASSNLMVYDVVCDATNATITINSSDGGTNSEAGAGTNYILLKKEL